jgi:hypothetical protein
VPNADDDDMSPSTGSSYINPPSVTLRLTAPTHLSLDLLYFRFPSGSHSRIISSVADCLLAISSRVQSTAPWHPKRHRLKRATHKINERRRRLAGIPASYVLEMSRV